MVQAMDRLSADSGAMCIDVKQSCLAHNWGIITAAFVVKDKLRNTNFTRVAGKRVQGTAYTSHAEPVLQAIVNVESTDNVIQFLNTLKRLWSKYCPTKKPLDTWVEQVHKDYHKALEAARRQCMPHARPVNDFFHLTEKESTMDSKLIHVSATPGKHHKEHKSWLMHSLRLQRHLPTLDLSSAIYKGFLQRLSSLGEEEVRDYLGPSGHPTYCIELGVQELHDSYGVTPLTQNLDEQIIFCYHWSGLYGTIPGTDCGDQPLEAFHSPWQTQLDTLGHQTQAPRALDTMQTVYRTWNSQLSWSSSTPLLMVPPSVDEKLWNSPMLNQLGRSTMFDFAEAAKTGTIHCLHEATDKLHLLAMPFSLQHTFDCNTALVAARMLGANGASLATMLRDTGIWCDMPGPDGATIHDCSKMSKVKEYFVDMAFVFVRAPGHGPWPCFPGLLCTCRHFGRYAGCEHIEFAKTIDLPLRKATSTTDSLPVQQKRGRKRGPRCLKFRVARYP